MGVRMENGTCNLWVYEIEHRDLSYSFQHAAISEFLASVFCKHRSKAWTISTNPWAVTRLVCYGMFISAWPVTSSICQFLKNSTTRLTFFRTDLKVDQPASASQGWRCLSTGQCQTSTTVWRPCHRQHLPAVSSCHIRAIVLHFSLRKYLPLFSEPETHPAVFALAQR